MRVRLYLCLTAGNYKFSMNLAFKHTNHTYHSCPSRLACFILNIPFSLRMNWKGHRIHLLHSLSVFQFGKDVGIVRYILTILIEFPRSLSCTLSTFLVAKSNSIRGFVRPSLGRSVGPFSNIVKTGRIQVNSSKFKLIQ